MKKNVIVTHRNRFDTNLFHLLSGVFQECRIEWLAILPTPALNHWDNDAQHEGDRHDHQKTVPQEQTRLQSNVQN